MTRLYFPHTLGNRAPIWQVLEPLLKGEDPILEVASGSGEHVHEFARLRPELRWIPSDPNPEHRASIRAWCQQLSNVAEALALDARHQPWNVAPLQGVVAINLIHIAPWEATLGLIEGSRKALRPGGFLYLYGAFKRDGRHTAPSNESFDRALRAEDPSWGVRDLEREVVPAAAGFRLERVVEMPVNNLSVVFRKPGVS